MAYSAMARQVLLSCPSDIEKGDLETVRQTINRWNVLLGSQFGTVVVPISWNEHAASALGVSAQDVLNEQLVDSADFVIALFWTRLGTPTNQAQSGTAEEINRLRDSGKPVSVLKCSKPIDPGAVDLQEQARLEEYLRGLYESTLVLHYKDAGQLSSRVDAILTRQATSLAGEDQLAKATAPRRAEVWPHVDVQQYQETDTRGRLRSKRRFSLVLANAGDEPARNVSFELESDGDSLAPRVLEEDSVIEVLPPKGNVSFPMLLAMGMSNQALCTVRWEDSGGSHNNQATVRFS